MSTSHESIKTPCLSVSLSLSPFSSYSSYSSTPPAPLEFCVIGLTCDQPGLLLELTLRSVTSAPLSTGPTVYRTPIIPCTLHSSLSSTIDLPIERSPRFSPGSQILKNCKTTGHASPEQCPNAFNASPVANRALVDHSNPCTFFLTSNTKCPGACDTHLCM
jgi:hypothetical protein